ncbi:hypothetical protein ACJW30_07G092100 [Castanea mollissima]
MAHLSIFLSSLLVLAVLHSQTTPGGARFRNQLGAEYTRQTMESATNFIWNIFQQTTESDRKNYQNVNLFVEEKLTIENALAVTSGNEIKVLASYIEGIKGDIKWDFNGVLYHEMAHVWQWNGQSLAPGGLIEGIADYMRLKANYAPSHWVKPGEGKTWDQGYMIDGFVAELNKKMKDGYNDSFFVDLLGKPVDQLWSDYKAKYGMGN